jgi:hypothetical protein
MTNLLNEISVTIPSGGRELRFQTTKDVLRWAASERPFWSSVDVNHIHHHLSQLWQQQTNFFDGIASLVQDFERHSEQGEEAEARQSNDRLRNHFNRLANGEVISSDHELYPAIQDMAKTTPSLAAVLLASAKSDADNTLGNFANNRLPFSLVIRLILQYSRSKGTRDWLKPQRKELTGRIQL